MIRRSSRRAPLAADRRGSQDAGALEDGRHRHMARDRQGSAASAETHWTTMHCSSSSSFNPHLAQFSHAHSARQNLDKAIRIKKLCECQLAEAESKDVIILI